MYDEENGNPFDKCKTLEDFQEVLYDLINMAEDNTITFEEKKFTMVIQVRFGVFETNSSSTHSLVICSDEELDLWKEGKLVYKWRDNLIPSTNEEGEEGENFSQFCGIS